MKLLVGADLHNNARGMNWFCELADAEAPDVVVFLGDFITFSPMSFARQAIRDLASLASKVVVVPGNCDPRDILLDLEKAEGIVSLHNRQLEIGGLRFAGKGGSIPCPSPTPFEEDDETFADSLSRVAEDTEILVLHQPAHGYRDAVSEGKHVGSQSLRKLVDRLKPRLVLSGHIHEARGIDRHRGTVFVNPGALLAMSAAVVLYGEDIEVSFRKDDA
ncbi:MAG: hypothetical protein B1H03_00855 [Planctomycetales bacterium 4484_113]|nr:MAG: hypothetical protein B1H03_00855 [Planctomycetales bacterium 4484_113]